MIVKRSKSANPWQPQGFEAYARHYPCTVWDAVPPESDLTDAFIARWRSNEPCRRVDVGTVVLTPGLFSEWLPGCFASASRALTAAGFRVIHTRVRSRYGARDQAARLASELSRRLAPGERFVWCGHSKGAIDLLYALETTYALRDGCVVAVAVQPAVGTSRVIERWQNSPRGLLERAGGALTATAPVRAGVREISRQRDPAIAGWLARFEPVVPTVCAVSWSIRPTSWVDSYHRTLNEIAPGHAHDGQFLTVDQRLPSAALVCLPELDHAQPVLGGLSFDVGRFWQALVGVALLRAGEADARAAQTR